MSATEQILNTEINTTTTPTTPVPTSPTTPTTPTTTTTPTPTPDEVVENTHTTPTEIDENTESEESEEEEDEYIDDEESSQTDDSGYDDTDDDEEDETELEISVYGKTMFKDGNCYSYVITMNDKPIAFNYHYDSAKKTLKSILNMIVVKNCGEYRVVVDKHKFRKDVRYTITYVPRNIFSFKTSSDVINITKIYRAY